MSYLLNLQFAIIINHFLCTSTIKQKLIEIVRKQIKKLFLQEEYRKKNQIEAGRKNMLREWIQAAPEDVKIEQEINFYKEWLRLN